MNFRLRTTIHRTVILSIPLLAIVATSRCSNADEPDNSKTVDQSNAPRRNARVLETAGVVQSLSWTDEGTTLAVQTSPSESAQRRTYVVRLWDVASGRVTRTLVSSFEVSTSMASSPDGRNLACGFWTEASVLEELLGKNFPRRHTEARIRSLDSGKRTAVFRGAPQKELGLPFTSDVLSLAYSPDGSLLAGGSKLTSAGKFYSGQHLGGEVWVWDARTGDVRWFDRTTHSDIVYAVAFSPDGKQLVSGGIDGLIRIWNPETGNLQRTLFGVARGGVSSLAFSPDGSILASGADGGEEGGIVRIWDFKSGELKHALTGFKRTTVRIAFSTDGRTLFAVGSKKDAPEPAFEIRTWDTANGQSRGIFDERPGYARAIAVSPNGKTLAIGTFEEQILLYNLND